MNDSSTGGYLSPAAATPPEEDLELDRLLSQMVRGISGLPEGAVRPRWQPTTPKQPPSPDENWCAIGISDQTPDASPAILHDPAGDGRDIYWRHQDIELLCTFYGAQAKMRAQALADGVGIPQNREALGLREMAVIGTGPIRAVPELVNNVWVRRYDLIIFLRRKISRTYSVLNLLSAETTTHTEAGGAVVDPVP